MGFSKQYRVHRSTMYNITAKYWASPDAKSFLVNTNGKLILWKTKETLRGYSLSTLHLPNTSVVMSRSSFLLFECLCEEVIVKPLSETLERSHTAAETLTEVIHLWKTWENSCSATWFIYWFFSNIYLPITNQKNTNLFLIRNYILQFLDIYRWYEVWDIIILDWIKLKRNKTNKKIWCTPVHKISHKCLVFYEGEFFWLLLFANF